LSDLRALLSRAGIETDEPLAADAERLRGCVPEIMAAAAGLLARVKAGELATAPAASPGDSPLISARVGWL
jgi:hypothetical protein